MAKAYRCDRCGKLFEIETRQQYIRDHINLRMADNDNPYKLMDICVECQDGFINWWNKHQQKEISE